MPTRAVLTSPLVLPPGPSALAIRYVGCRAVYTNNPLSPRQTYSNADASVELGSSTSVAFGGALFERRIWNGTIFYTDGPGGLASAIPFGAGCGGRDSSFYESFGGSPRTFDLDGSGFRLRNRGSQVVPGTVNPIVMPTSTRLGFRDDETRRIRAPFPIPFANGTTNDIWLCSNGWLSFEPTTSVSRRPSTADLVNGPTRLAFVWDDLRPQVNFFNGGIFTQVDPNNPNLWHITFVKVTAFGSGGVEGVQVSIDNNGDIEVKYDPNNRIFDCLVGYSPRTDRGLPEPTDISGLMGTKNLAVSSAVGASLRASSRPVLGGNLDIEIGADASATLAINIGLAIPMGGIDLTSSGLPGCSLLVSPSFSSGAMRRMSFQIPTNAELSGAVVNLQAVAANPNYVGGVATSNGVKAILGAN